MGGVKHTAGPWVAAPYSSMVGAPVVASPSGRPVCSVTYFALGDGFEGHDEVSAANARLIAAAPDLLEALELALEYFNSAQAQLSASGQVARDAARAAIAKATGETK